MRQNNIPPRNIWDFCGSSFAGIASVAKQELEEAMTTVHRLDPCPPARFR
jgi:hypothetical protein